MLKVCNKGDLIAVLGFIAQGIDTNFIVDSQSNISLLSDLIITGTTTTYVLELLIQNRANINAIDSRGN